MASSNIETLTDQSWAQQVLASDKPVLVDFRAECCAPCKAMVPDLEAVAAQYAGRVRVGKLNVEENERVPFPYGITAMPTLIAFKGGKLAATCSPPCRRSTVWRAAGPAAIIPA